jgi:hypothetical protein
MLLKNASHIAVKQVQKKFFTFLALLIQVQILFAQKDSLVKYSHSIKVGMTKNRTDSLMEFHFANMHQGFSGPTRYIYNDINQEIKDYKDKEWKTYTFRFLYEMDILIYFDLHYFKTDSILYSQIDSNRVKTIVSKFNKEYNASDNFNSILLSFSTTAYSLGKLDIFFSKATFKDKSILLKYAKSICPEYSASAIIRLLELEKKKAFLSLIQKKELEKIIHSGIIVKFVIGCIHEEMQISEFISRYRSELKNVIN